MRKLISLIILVKEPGKEFDYNNADYIILGKMIERISGKSFEKNLQEKILQPLQMQNSGMLSQRSIIDHLADTYFFREDLNTIVNDSLHLSQVTCFWNCASDYYFAELESSNN